MIIPNLRNCREYILELKQKDIATFFNLSPSTISGWETGFDTMPIKHLLLFASHYEISLDYLFGIINYNIKYSKINISTRKLGRNLKKLRLKNNMTQIEIAKKIHTFQNNYTHYETGTNIIPTNFLYGLIQVYKPFSIDELFDRKIIK